MKTLKDFTPEIKSKIQIYKDKAVKDLYSGKEYKDWKRKNTVDYIEYIYKLAKQPDKPVVIIANNLIQYRQFYNLIFNKNLNKKYVKLINFLWFIKNKKKALKNKLSSELRSELGSELYSELDSELGSELGSELDSELGSELDSELGSELYSELGSELYSELRSELGSELRSVLGSELGSVLGSELGSELDSELGKKPKYHYLFLITEYSRVYLMWYKFIKEEFKIKTKKETQLDWLYENVNKANISKSFLCKKIVLVLRMPEKINRNAQFLHSNTDAAIIYSNQKLYYIYGVKINKTILDSLVNKTYTFEDFSKEPNEEVKAAILNYFEENYGGEYLYRFLSNNLKEVDTYVHKKEEKYLEGTTKNSNIGVYTLFKGSVNNIDIAYVRCYCPSTDRIFFLGVHESVTNAKDAIASLCQIPFDLKNTLSTITRCGEIYSFNFNEEGVKKIKNKQVNIENVVSLTGDEYFSKLIWEY